MKHSINFPNEQAETSIAVIADGVPVLRINTVSLRYLSALQHVGMAVDQIYQADDQTPETGKDEVMEQTLKRLADELHAGLKEAVSRTIVRYGIQPAEGGAT